jgi:hypothetical protein
MTFQEFADQVGFNGSEVDKARLIAYFLAKEHQVTDLVLNDILKQWEQLNVAQPNRSRLQQRMSDSGSFPRSPQPGKIRLHGNDFKWLDEQHGAMWLQAQPRTRSGALTFVDEARLAELRTLRGKNPDPTRLVRLCEEINSNYQDQCYMAVALLARTVINHVPPVFGFKTFAEVAANYGGPKAHRSFKTIAQRLENAARDIGDMIAHEVMQPVEALPNPTQIDFTQEFDVLLQEVVRILQAKP